MHGSVHPIYSKSLNPDESEKHFCGCISKLDLPGGAHFVTTKHQWEAKDLWVVDKAGKKIPIHDLPWVDLPGVEKTLLKALPAKYLQLGGNALKVGGRMEHNSPALFITYDPRTQKPAVGATTCYYSPKQNFITHSCSTQNYSCGSLILHNEKVVGVHSWTDGDGQKENNHAEPLF